MKKVDMRFCENLTQIDTIVAGVQHIAECLNGIVDHLHANQVSIMSKELLEMIPPKGIAPVDGIGTWVSKEYYDKQVGTSRDQKTIFDSKEPLEHINHYNTDCCGLPCPNEVMPKQSSHTKLSKESFNFLSAYGKPPFPTNSVENRYEQKKLTEVITEILKLLSDNGLVESHNYPGATKLSKESLAILETLVESLAVNKPYCDAIKETIEVLSKCDAI